MTSGKQERFSEAVCKELGNYVYRLIDPRNGETFYVGKGKNNRVFEHVEGQIKISKTPEKGEDEVSAKLKRIREILGSGLDVIHIIHRHGIPKENVYEVEAALIDAYAGLSNVAGGHGSNDRGPMHAKEIIAKYGLPVIDQPPRHKLVLINVNKFDGVSREGLYNQVRFSWRISLSKARKADYVLAVVRGVIVGAFVASRWEKATRENFPEIQNEEPERKAFEGKPASDEVWEEYCGDRGKRISLDGLKHVQNPIRYWGID